MNEVALSPARWLDQIKTAWRWWLGELAALAPAPLRHALAAPPDAIFIDVQPDEFVAVRRASGFETVIARIPRDDFAARTLRLSAPSGAGLSGLLADPIVLRLPAEEALARSLRLPRAAARNLGAILRHEVVRQSPLGADDIYYDYRIESAGPEALDVAMRIVRRGPVEAIVQTCRDAGIALAGIAFAGDAAPAAGGTFPADAAAARRRRWLPRIVPALAGLVLLLAAGFVASLYLRGEALASELTDKVDAARGRAAVVEQLERELDSANRQAAFLARQKHNPPAVAVLANVARLLPDNAWLYEFELNGDEVRLHGFSSQAASLISVFDASPFFSGAQFRAPLMQGPTSSLQRFDLSMKIGKSAT